MNNLDFFKYDIFTDKSGSMLKLIIKYIIKII